MLKSAAPLPANTALLVAAPVAAPGPAQTAAPTRSNPMPVRRDDPRVGGGQASERLRDAASPYESFPSVYRPITHTNKKMFIKNHFYINIP